MSEAGMVSALKEFPFWWRQIINSQINKMILGSNGYYEENNRKDIASLVRGVSGKFSLKTDI